MWLIGTTYGTYDLTNKEIQTNSGAGNTMVVSELTWKGSRGDLLVFLGYEFRCYLFAPRK
jgi:hypothetical protein